MRRIETARFKCLGTNFLHALVILGVIGVVLWSPIPVRVATGTPASEPPTSLTRVHSDNLTLTLRAAIATEQAYDSVGYAFSPDSKIFATVDKHHAVNLWDTQTGRPNGSLAGHKKFLSWIEFSPDGRRLATASADKTAKLWDVEKRSLVATLSGQSGAVERARFSPDGSVLLTTASCPFISIHRCKRTIRLWHPETGALKAELLDACDWPVRGGFSADSKHVALVCATSKARVWNTESGALEATFVSPERDHPHFFDAQLTPDGGVLATRNLWHRVHLWDMRTGKEAGELAGNEIADQIDLSPSGKLLATSNGLGKTKIWDLQTGNLLATFGSNTKNMPQHDMAEFSPDERTLVTTNREKREALVWDVSSGKLRWTIPTGKYVLGPFLFSADSRFVVAAGSTVTVCNLETGEYVANLKDSFYPTLISPDGRTLATQGGKKVVLLWNLQK
jgi:WD40 repeat protein